MLLGLPGLNIRPFGSGMILFAVKHRQRRDIPSRWLLVLRLCRADTSWDHGSSCRSCASGLSVGERYGLAWSASLSRLSSILVNRLTTSSRVSTSTFTVLFLLGQNPPLGNHASGILYGSAEPCSGHRR